MGVGRESVGNMRNQSRGVSKGNRRDWFPEAGMASTREQFRATTRLQRSSL